MTPAEQHVAMLKTGLEISKLRTIGTSSKVPHGFGRLTREQYKKVVYIMSNVYGIDNSDLDVLTGCEGLTSHIRSLWVSVDKLALRATGHFSHQLKRKKQSPIYLIGTSSQINCRCVVLPSAFKPEIKVTGEQ